MSQLHKGFHKITQIDPLRRRVRELIGELRTAREENKPPLYLQLVSDELNLCLRRYRQAQQNPSGIPQTGMIDSVTQY